MYNSNALRKVQMQGSAMFCFGILFMGIFSAWITVPLFFSVQDVPSSYIFWMSGLTLFLFVVHGVTLPVFVRDYKRYKKGKQL